MKSEQGTGDNKAPRTIVLGALKVRLILNTVKQIEIYFFNTFLHHVRLLQLGHFKYRVVPLCIALSA